MALSSESARDSSWKESTSASPTGTRSGSSGRNGAGKTTLTKVLAARACPPAAGSTAARRSATSRRIRAPGNPEDLARTRILDARGLGSIVLGMQQSTHRHGQRRPRVSAAAMKKYGGLEEQFHMLGGYAAEAEAASIASNLNLPDRILDQQLKTLSGGQRRRIELARILFSGRRDDDPRRADEPPRRRLGRLAA